MGIDPGYKNGCKCAIINANGRKIDTFKISVNNEVKMKDFVDPPEGIKPMNDEGRYYKRYYPNNSRREYSEMSSLSSSRPFQPFNNYIPNLNRRRTDEIPHWKKSVSILIEKITKYNVDIIAIGNGTASHKAQILVAKAIIDFPDVNYVVVDESGSSSYSVTPEAKMDNNNIDELYISALSIARRVAYPLSEYVKMNPNTIGIGQYQKDLDENELKESFDMIIRKCVSNIGVDVNKASSKLLSYVSGIDEKTSKEIYQHCSKNQIKSRKELEKLLPPNVYKMCAENSPEPLDNTIIHPDDYEFFYSIINKDLMKDKNKISQLNEVVNTIDKSKFSGREYIYDFLKNSTVINLSKSLKQYHDIVCHDNADVGCQLKGRVESITDFGAFIHVNLSESAFLYKSDMASDILKENGYGDELKIGDYVNVEVTYKEYKDLVFVDDEMDDKSFNRKYHELLRTYKKSDIGKKREGVVKKVEFGVAEIELSKNQSGSLDLKDYKHDIKVGDKIFVAIAFASIKYFIVKLLYK